MFVKTLLNPNALCNCTGNLQTQTTFETTANECLSPIRKQTHRDSLNHKKKISISKHVQSSLKKRKFNHLLQNQGSKKKSQVASSALKASEPQMKSIAKQNRVNFINQTQAIYPSKPLIIRQEPKTITKQYVHITHQYHITTVEQHQSSHRNSSPGFVFSSISIPSRLKHQQPSNIQFSKIQEKSVHRSQLRHNQKIGERSNISSTLEVPSSSNQTYGEMQGSMERENRSKNDNVLTEFRQVESEIGDYLQNSIQSTMSVLDKKFIFEMQNYYAKGINSSSKDTPNKAQVSTLQDFHNHRNR